ncbi:MarR family winged helix-turn-helix transcriptional regulator [Streptomyces hoynatensis]|uniref:MarR family winged helix-turn-helix transcriptional regulator n=1 Tax=Streptomyces hoynatensis TaxID=1141874 RepID=UPI00131A22D8|nr:MarR family transcriptional regulator [Streptomyces hoynatensis]
MEHSETPEPAALGELYRSLSALSWLMAGHRTHLQLRAEVDIALDRASLALLRVLAREPAPVRIGRLAELLRVQAPHVTREVRNLEARGLVEVSAEAGDRRVRRASATKDGREALARFEAIGRERLARAVEGVAPEDLHTTATVIDRVVAAFREP